MQIKFERWIAEKILVASSVAVLAYLLWGYSYGILTNEYHITLVLKSAGAFPFHGDAMADTLGGYASPLWFAISRVVGLFPISALFFAGFVFSRMIFAWAIGSLAASFLTDPQKMRLAWMVGAISTVAFGWIVPLPVGGDPVLGPYFSQTFLSIGLLAWSIAMALRKKWNGSALILGLAFNVNIMQSALACGIIGILWFSMAIPLRKINVIRFGKTVGICCLVALPGLFLAIRSMLNSTGSDFLEGQQLSDWARFWLEGHFFASGRSFLRILSMFSLLLLPVVLLHQFEDRTLRRRAIVAVMVPTALTLFQMLFAGVAPSRVLFQLHLFRSDVLAYCLVTAMAVGLAIQARRKDQHEFVSSVTLALLLLAGGFLQAMVIAISSLILNVPNQRTTQIQQGFSVLLLLGGGVWSLQSGVKVSGVLLILTCVSLVFKVIDSRGWFFHVLVILSVVVGLVNNWLFWKNVWVQNNFATQYGEQTPHAKQLRAFGDSTPVNAVFLLPPSVNARPFLRRGVWFNFYDGADFLWRKGAELGTLERMKALGIRYEPGARVDLDSMDTQWYAGLCQSLPKVAQAGVTHVVIPDAKNKSAPWSLHDPASAMTTLGCAVLGTGSP